MTTTEQQHGQRLRAEHEALLHLGVFVDVDITGLHMLTARATWDDLGVPAEERRRKRISTGRTNLFPNQSKKLESLDTRLRENLRMHSYDVPGFAPYRWIPTTAYHAWLNRHDTLADQFYAVRRELIEQYDFLRDDLVTDWADVAHEAYDAWISRTAHNEQRQQFIARVVQAVLRRMPTIHEIQQKMHVRYKTNLFDEPRMSTQAYLRRVASDLRIDTDALFDMHSQHRQRTGQQVSETASPLEHIGNTFEQSFQEAIEDIQAVLQRNGTLPGRAIEKLRNLKRAYDLLAVQRNSAVEVALDSLLIAAQPTGDNRMQDRVGAIQDALREVAAAIRETPRSIQTIAGNEFAYLEWDD